MTYRTLQLALLVAALLSSPACVGSDPSSSTGDAGGNDGSGGFDAPADASDLGSPDAGPDLTGEPPRDAPEDDAAEDDGTHELVHEPDAGDANGSGDTADSDAPCGEPVPWIAGAELTAAGGWQLAEAARCTWGAHVAVVPSGATWRVDAINLTDDSELRVYGAIALSSAAGPLPPPLAASEPAGSDGSAGVEFVPAFSGEQLIVVARGDPTRPSRYTIRVTCMDGCERETTRFPVVFLHGYAGTDSYFGILDYFYDTHDPLWDLGYPVYMPTANPLATSETRAEELDPKLDEILAATGARKLNLLGHSQGGLDARVLTSGRGFGPRVASVTTVATPHHGIPLVLQDFLSVQDFSPEYMEGTFNAAYPNLDGVAYFSWTGKSCRNIDFDCREEESGEVIDTLLIASYNLLARFGDNDGIVPTDAGVWGMHLGEISGDHFDEVGQIADGERDDDPFDHRAFYLGEMRRLRDAGF